MKKLLLLLIVVVAGLLYMLSIREIPTTINYGVSFSVLHSKELGLDWKPVYDAILDDLKVRKLRLSAHWPLIEPQQGTFNWTELDYQIKEAEKRNAKVVLAVGRRLPGWPECHEPDWAYSLSHEDKKTAVKALITAVMNRYKDSPAVAYWQVENEPFLTAYATYHCKDFLDENFLKEEVALIKSLDANTPVLVTDSGEVSLWYKAWRSGDAFGTSVYLYVWNHYVGAIRYPITPAFFRIKTSLLERIVGHKDSILIELSTEPWLLKPIIEASTDEQLTYMNLDRFNKIIEFAKKTGFEDQYLWGAEWWYYMNEKDHPEFWERAKEIYSGK